MKMIALMLTARLVRYLNDQRMSRIWMNVVSATLLQVRDGDVADVSVYFQQPTTGNIFSDQFPVKLSLLIEFGAIAANGTPVNSETKQGEVSYSLSKDVDLDKYRIPEPSESRYGIMPLASQNPVDGSVLDEINKTTLEAIDRGINKMWDGWFDPKWRYVSPVYDWPEPKPIQGTTAEPELPNPRKGLRQIEV